MATAHLHRTDFDADNCPLCFPDGDAEDAGQPCTGCGVTLFGYPVPRCEWCAHADEAAAAERQRWAEGLGSLHRIQGGGDYCTEDGFHWPCHTARKVADLLDGAS